MELGTAEVEAATAQLVRYQRCAEAALPLAKRLREEMAEFDPAILEKMRTINEFAKAGPGLRDTTDAMAGLHAQVAKNAEQTRIGKGLDAAADVGAERIRAEGTVEIDAMKAEAAEAAEARHRKHMRQLDEEDADHKAMLARKHAPAPAPAPAAAPAVDNNHDQEGLVTIRSVANHEGLLDDLPPGERDAVLMEVGRRFAAAFRAGGGVERRVLEHHTHVCGYPADAHDDIAAMVHDVIEERGRALGPVTVATFQALLARAGKKGELALRIMAEAEALAIDEVLERPNGQLLGKQPRTKRQTFAETDRALVKKHVRSALQAATNNRAINAFFSAPAAPAAP
jgi:hypothetical protein